MKTTTVNNFFQYKAMPVIPRDWNKPYNPVPADIDEKTLSYTKRQGFLHNQQRRMPFSNKRNKMFKTFSKFGLKWIVFFMGRPEIKCPDTKTSKGLQTITSA